MIVASYFIFKGGLFNVICAPQTPKQILNFLIAQTLQKRMKKISDYPLIKHFYMQEVKKTKRSIVQDHWQGGDKDKGPHWSE